MELKIYQKKVIKDLNRFLEILNNTQNIPKAYTEFWQEQDVPVGYGGVPTYNNTILRTPHICFKVPTGGGKTFIACNSIKPVFDNMQLGKAKVVAWFVPTDSILEQTVKCLQDVHHPYRQKIDTDFGGRVEVLTKQQALNGQNFNPDAVSEQLTILVLSYDSFRSNTKENRKVYQENGYLARFPKGYSDHDALIDGVDETALVQVINQLSPLIIVDESHHAISNLSIEMLQNLNPCFLIDLTATPKKNSNIISYVDALQLKKESMVKLPVIVYNRHSKEDVLIDAIDLRKSLEQAAKAEREITGKYIRPIVLFQAQSKGKDDNTTFEKLKEQLIALGIQREEIAIKTSNVNELKNIDLMSENCNIRFIITVNALKEGWDCPFAYILATLANRTSSVDVEQILGRILRQPYTKQHKSGFLNMSYTLTSSSDFRTTIDKIIVGLNNAGFSKSDYRVADEASEEQIVTPQQQFEEQQQLNLEDTELGTQEEFLEFDIERVKTELEERENQANIATDTSGDVNSMFSTALEQGQAYNTAVGETDGSEIFSQPVELRDKMNMFTINDEYLEDIADLKIPQFSLKIPHSLFDDGGFTLLTQNTLAEGFSLRDKDTEINFNSLDDEIIKVDIEGGKEAVPKASKLDKTNSQAFKEYFSNKPTETKLKICKDMIHKQLNRIDTVDSADLSRYIDRIVETLNADQIAELETNITSYTEKIKKKILSMQAEFAEKQFSKLLEQGKIVCIPQYVLKEIISPLENTTSISKSLYTAEEGNMNNFEYRVITNIASLENVKWWHRNISRNEFCINGFINHYPDFIIMTTSGRIIVVETKGDYLENQDSRQKIKLGRTWQNHTDDKFRYYMVFDEKDLKIEGAYQFDEFMDIIREL